MNAKSNPGGFTPFNHGYLCQMLRSASDGELANVINDVIKEQQRRNSQKNSYAKKITDALHEAVNAGYKINVCSNDNSESALFSIAGNSINYISIELD